MAVFSDFETSDSINTLKSASTSVPIDGWQIEILQLPSVTTVEEVQTLFTKYGNIERVAIFYKVKDSSLHCYLSFEKESDSVEALRENGKKWGSSAITVIKYSHSSDGDKGNKRMRTESIDDGWGSTTKSDSNNNNSSSGGWGTTTSDNKGGPLSGWSLNDVPVSDSWGGDNNSSSGGRGRGRGGGGRGGGGGRSCFKCGEEGHMSRECPKGGGGGGGGGSRSCFKCGEEGHISRECPKGGGGGGGGRSCFKCGEEGHISRDCPKGGGRGCFNCGEEGHMSRECSKPRRGRGGGSGGFAGGNGGNRNNNSSSGTLQWFDDEPAKPASTAPTGFSSALTDWD